MSDQPSKAVLVTGCSTGIGRATALRLARAGFPVFATARRVESVADLAGAGCRTLALDVMDEGSMRAAVEAVEKEAGAVGALVNNAGYGCEGPVEEVPLLGGAAVEHTYAVRPAQLDALGQPLTDVDALRQFSHHGDRQVGDGCVAVEFLHHNHLL